MARRIHILPDAVANQIAAGEVVERPASVVKELVENALDAGATRIHVEVEGGGKQRIRVSDDGMGMGREDALLSLDRHATSKISEARDLTRIHSFGFRGEALPSIAAVSHFTLETREAEDEAGTAVRVEGGRIVGVQDFPRRPGTTVEVRSLFFNAPARRKFLKSAAAETRAMSEAITNLALTNPSVSFSLRSGDRNLLDLPSVKDVATRVGTLWGREAATSLLHASGEAEGHSMKGLIQRPEEASPGFRRAYLFVNGRPFRDPALLRAADRGYRTTLSTAQRPWLFLYLRVKDALVDVNVHPAKLEVRFRNPGLVHEMVEEAVRRALGAAVSGATLDTQLAPPRMEVREVPQGGDGGGDRPGRGERTGRAVPESQMALFLSGAVPRDSVKEAAADSGLEEAPRGLSEARPRLWQIHDTYVLAETREGLLIIDQHSAHERVLFQRLMEAFQAQGQESQALLFPLTLRLSPAELKQVEELKGILSRAGFEVEAFGGDTVIVHAVPNPHPYFNAERCLREMISELTEGSELVGSAKNQHERIAMTFACKGAIKAGQRMRDEEMNELFDALFATDLPFHDVHGRPTIVRLSTAELERKFGRH
jgi:DNA mismatch repair protein MutL